MLGGKIKISRLPYLLLFAMIFMKVLYESLLIIEYPGFKSVLTILLLCCRVILVLIVVKNNTKTNLKALASLALFGIVVLFQLIYVGSFDIFDMFIFTVALPLKKYDEVINVYFISIASATIFIVTLYFLGAMPEYMIYRSGTSILRYSFGFTHPNVFARMVMIITMLWIVKRKSIIKIFDYILLFVMAGFIYFIPNSTTVAIVILLLDVLLVLERIYKIINNKNWTQNKWFRGMCYLLVPAIVFIIYKGGLLQFADFTSTFLYRFSTGLSAINTYGISIFGQEIEFVGTVAKYFGLTSDSYFQIDCLYFLLPIKYGIIATMYFCYMYVKCMRQYLLKSDVLMSLYCIIFAIYSISESGVLSIASSFIFVCAMSSSSFTSQNSFAQLNYYEEMKSKSSQLN